MNPNSANPFQPYVSGGTRETIRPLGLGGQQTSPFETYTSRKLDLKDPEGLYELAVRAGLKEEADKMVQRSGGEEMKYLSGGFIMDAMDILNTSSYGMVGLVKGKGFIEGIKNRESLADEDALGKYGWQGKVAGFIGDIVLDPLNYIAPQKLIFKIPGVKKGITSLGERMFGRLEEIEVGAGGLDQISSSILMRKKEGKTFDEFKAEFAENFLPKDFGGSKMREKIGLKEVDISKLKMDPRYGKNGKFSEEGEAFFNLRPNHYMDMSVEEILSKPILVDDGFGKNVVRDGNHRLVALREKGYTGKVKTITTDGSGTQLKKIWDAADTEIVDKETVLKAAANATLSEIETIKIPGQKTFKREGGWTPLTFLADKFVYGFAADPKFLNGVQKIAGRNDAIIADAEKLFQSFSKLKPGIFEQTIKQGEDGRMISTPLNELEIEMRRQGLDSDFDSIKEMYQLRDNLMNRLEELGVLTKETKETHWGTYLKQSYDEYIMAKKPYMGTKSGVTIDSKKRVEGLTPEMMKELGQVEDPHVLWATTLIKQIDMVKKAELQKFTADGYALSTDMLEEFGRQGGKVSDLHQFPNDPRRYGALAGKYVSNEIWNVLKGSFEPTKELGENLVLNFKHIKVVWNPASHVRNAFGAAIQNWWKMGLGPWRIDKYYDAVRELKGGQYLQEMRDLGFSERSGYLGELVNNYINNEELMTKAIAKQFGTTKGVKKYLKKLDRLIMNSYGHTDNVAKMAAYKTLRQKGVEPEKAFAEAMAATFNYSEVTPFVHQMRRAIWGVPFITFAVKAVPLVATTLANNPGRISVFGKARNALFQAAGVEGEQEAEALPEHMRDDMFVMRLPWKDELGRSMYFDLSYIVPFGAIADGTIFENPLAMNPVTQLIRELSRNETFTGNKIFRESDDIDKVIMDIAIHVGKLGIPPIFVDGMSDGYGRDGERVDSKLGWERAVGIDTDDLGPGERTHYQNAMRLLGLGAVPYELNSRQSSMAYTQKENLTKLLTENGVIKSFQVGYLPQDSELRPENQGMTLDSVIYDRDVRPIGR